MNLWSRIVDALAAEEGGTTLALWRIAVGAVLFVDLLGTWRSGAHQLVFHGPEGGGYRALTGTHWLWSVLGPPTDAHADATLVAGLVASAAVVAGLGTRFAAAVALVSAQALWSLNGYSGGGHDRMITISMFVLVLARSDATLSLRTRLRSGAWTAATQVKRWPRALITWNLTLVYTATGMVKFNDAWMPTGPMDAVYTALSMPHYAYDSSASWVAQNLFPLTQVGTVVALAFELSFGLVPLWLLLRGSTRWGPIVSRVNLRGIYLAVGVVLHGSLMALMNLGPFGAITLAWYLMLFRPDELSATWARWAPSAG